MLAALGGGGLLAGLGSLAGGLFTNASNRNIASSANQAAELSSERQMQFQEQMSSTAWQRGVKDMEAAGLNPMLAYSQGPATTPTGSSFNPQVPTMRNPVPEAVQAYNNSAATAAQVKQADAQTQNLVAMADKAKADADYTRTVTSGYQGEQQARVASIKATTEKTITDTNLSAHQALLVIQEVKNAIAENRQIQANTSNAEANTALTRIKAQLANQQMPEASALANLWTNEPDAAAHAVVFNNPFRAATGKVMPWLNSGASAAGDLITNYFASQHYPAVAGPTAHGIIRR